MERIDQPQNARSRRTRAALLDSTWRLVESEGPEAVTMDRVARDAGTSRRAVYLHFASRADLMVALLDHVDTELDLEASLRPVRDAPTLVATFDAWARHVAGYGHRLLPVVRAIDHARRTDPDAQALWEVAMANWSAGCRGLAEAAATDGGLAEPWDVDTATDLLWALMGVELLEDLVEDRGWSEQRYAERLALVARRTLLVDPDGHGQG